MFYKEEENIKQALIDNGFPNYIVDERIKRMIKNLHTVQFHPVNKHLSNFFTATGCSTIINQTKKWS